MYKIIEGGVTAAIGYKAAGLRAGVKPNKTNKDMAMVFSDVPAVSAGVFTRNVVKAAPVLVDRDTITNFETARAIVVNSGNANACTGAQGIVNVKTTMEEAAKALSIKAEEVLVCSTGVIGQQLPLEVILKGCNMLPDALSSDLEGGEAAAEAILTTDTCKKQVAVTLELGGKTVTIGAMCKGSGMIHPNMCTMLGFVTTDANISKEMLQKAVSASVVDSFNMISVDGDTSTNDTLLVLANGLAGNEEIKAEDADYKAFCEALDYVTMYLAKKMAGDGEGATALFECQIVGADTKENARTLAKSVICSSLSKAAIFGHDANFGRFLCALGYSGVQFDPENVDLYFQSKSGRIHIYGEGIAKDYSEEEATKILSEPEVTAIADVKMGEATATAWGCDLTYDYVKINADYRS